MKPDSVLWDISFTVCWLLLAVLAWRSEGAVPFVVFFVFCAGIAFAPVRIRIIKKLSEAGR